MSTGNMKKKKNLELCAGLVLTYLDYRALVGNLGIEPSSLHPKRSR